MFRAVFFWVSCLLLGARVPCGGALGVFCLLVFCVASLCCRWVGFYGVGFSRVLRGVRRASPLGEAGWRASVVGASALAGLAPRWRCRVGVAGALVSACRAASVAWRSLACGARRGVRGALVLVLPAASVGFVRLSGRLPGGCSWRWRFVLLAFLCLLRVGAGVVLCVVALPLRLGRRALSLLVRGGALSLVGSRGRRCLWRCVAVCSLVVRARCACARRRAGRLWCALRAALRAGCVRVPLCVLWCASWFRGRVLSRRVAAGGRARPPRRGVVGRAGRGAGGRGAWLEGVAVAGAGPWRPRGGGGAVWRAPGGAAGARAWRPVRPPRARVAAPAGRRAWCPAARGRRSGGVVGAGACGPPPRPAAPRRSAGAPPRPPAPGLRPPRAASWNREPPGAESAA